MTVRRLFKFIFLSFAFSISIYAKHKPCPLEQIAFDEKHLACLKQTALIKSIGKNFLTFEERKNCPACAEPWPAAARYSEVYQRDYLPVGVFLNDMGGYFVAVMFKNDPSLYRLWLYEIDKNDFQLRAFEPIEPTTKEKQKMKEVTQNKLYAKYWLRAFN